MSPGATSRLGCYSLSGYVALTIGIWRGWPSVSSPKWKEINLRGSLPEYESILPQLKYYPEVVQNQCFSVKTFHDGGSTISQS